MSIRFHRGYWTIFSGDHPVVSCVSFERALALSVSILLEDQA